MSELTANKLGEEFGLEIIGDGECCINSASSLDEAIEGELSFMISSKYAKSLSNTKASAVIVPANIQLPQNGKVFLKSENPYVSFATILNKYFKKSEYSDGVSDQASISKSAKLGENCSVEPFVMIKDNAVIGNKAILMSGARIGNNVKLGDDCVIHSNVVIEDDSVIGDRVILHPGVIIGSDGFGFTQTEGGNVKLPHIGTVEIGDEVEVGANSTIDRSSLGKTIIGSGTKIDNLVQIGHGVHLGKHNVICAQTGIGGSVRTGDKVIIAPKAGVRDHVTIGSNATIGPAAGVTKDISEGALVSGFPAIPHGEWLKIQGMISNLPAIREQLKGLLKQD